MEPNNLYTTVKLLYPSKIVSVSVDALESDLVIEQQPEVI